MKEIRLKSMEINNFQKIKSSGVLLFPGNDVEIRGENETGKSTIANAFIWCFTGKNANDLKIFSIKPLDSEKNVIHYLETSVEVVLLVDGVEKKFKRVLKENWGDVRGSDDKIYKGDSTSGFVNGIPKMITDYQKEVSDVIDDELFKLLTSTTYFNSLHWTKQREIIFKLVQGIEDIDIINMFDSLKPLAKEVEGKTIEDLKAQNQLIMKECDKKIKGLPGEIRTLREINYNLPEDFNSGVNDSLLEIKSKKRDDLLKASNSKAQNAKLEEIEQAISSINIDVLRLNNKKEALLMDREHDKNRSIGELKIKAESQYKKIKGIEEKVLGLNERITKKENELAEKASELEKLRSEYKEIKNREFIADSDTCPTCGSKWPLEKIEEFEKHFNVDKARALEKNKENGKNTASEYETIKGEIEALQNQIKYEDLQKEELVGTYSELESEIKEIESQELDVNTSEIDAQVETYKNRINILKNELLEIKKNESSDSEFDFNQKEIEELASEIELLNKYKINYKNDVDRKESILLKEKEMKEEQAKFEKSSKIMSLIDTFTERKANVLADRINKPFQIVKFKLADKNNNGTVENTCIATVNGVPFPDVNTGAKIQAGLDIIKGLQEIYQVRMPIFVDNAEAVTKWLIDLESQMIKLYADPKCNALEFWSDNVDLVKPEIEKWSKHENNIKQ